MERLNKDKHEELQKTLEALTGKPYSGMYVTLPDEEPISKDIFDLYNLVHEKTKIDYKAYEISKTFAVLQAKLLKGLGIQELDIAWIGSLIYAAGKLEGIREERARRKKKA